MKRYIIKFSKHRSILITQPNLKYYRYNQQKHLRNRMQLHQNSLGIKQLHKTAEAIEWFTDIKKNNECRFIAFNICDVYPSINENLLKSAINQTIN